MPLDLRQLECFVAVAEEGGVGRAAARLHMTQPPLTRRIQRLEREVGAALFVRTARGVELTEPGQALLVEARRLIGLTERAIEITRARGAGESGELIVGYFGSVIFGPVPQLLAEFSLANPGIEIQLERLLKGEQVDALRDRRIHIGFSRFYLDEPGMVVTDLLAEPLFVALSDRHRSSGCSELPLAALAGEPFVLFPQARPSFADAVVQVCNAAGFQARVHREAEDAVTALAHVAIGAGVAVVPRSATRITMPGVAFVPLSDAPHQPLSCCHRADEATPVLRRLLDFLDTWRPPG